MSTGNPTVVVSPITVSTLSTNPISHFLTDLRKREINLWLEGEDRLGYSAPNGVMTADVLSQLRQRKPEILSFLKSASQARHSQTQKIQSGSADGSLSFAQERLWFLNQLEPDNPFYNVPCALRLRGKLDVAALQASLNAIVQRHEVLRTTFPAEQGVARQQIAATLLVDLPIVDLRQQPAPEAELIRLAVAESTKPFDLTRDPLLRATLLQLAEQDHALFVTMHHIVADGWSLGILVNEMSAFYRAFTATTSQTHNAERPILPDLPIQYADFATWQRQTFQGERLEQQLDYWVRQLAGAPPMIELPSDRPRPPQQSFQGRSQKFELDLALTQRLHALSQQQGATLFMTLYAAFATLLYRYSNQNDLVIGTPIANRNRSEIEPLIGFFVNTLALRIDLSGNPSFVELLQRARRVALEGYDHQDLPFEKLVEAVQPDRDLSRNPLFQVMFALQNAPVDALTLPNLQLSLVETTRATALFDMVLDFWQTPDGLVGVWEYNTDLFDDTTMQRMIGHLKTLLAAIAGDPACPIDELPLLNAAERKQLLLEFRGAQVAYPVELTLSQHFEQQVARGSERVAAVCAGQSISYGELNARANRIAHALRQQGVARNDFVGILAERGFDFLAAMLGVLKAGAAYLPIDPAYPAERVHYMISNSQIQTLITRAPLIEGQPALLASEHLRHFIDFNDATLAQQPSSNPPALNQPSDRAYMLYTSGSTGQPKGAIIRHNGAVNHIFAEFDLLKFHRDSAFLQSAPSSSDISVWQFLAPLLIGGHCVIADMETVADPARLFQLIKAARITLIELVPVVLKGLLEYAAHLPADEAALPDLECAMVTGEAVSVALVNQWIESYPAIHLVNAYGPTEAADDVSQFVIDRPLPSELRSVPIGVPLPNFTLYVLDAKLQLVPIGVAGEICVAGIGVGEGYWRNPTRTQAAFAPNPYATNEHDRVLYRTGDLGRWLPNGVLDFAQRIDQQVKLRGFRIELGEIENVLAQNPAVEKSAAAVRSDKSGDKHLVAYVVPSAEGSRLNDLQAEHVALWHDLHDRSYQVQAGDDPTFNTIGWDSSYSKEPLSAAEMHEYVDFTIARALALQPRRILEIGCGTGLLAFRLIAQCEQYWGIDLSSVAIQQLQRLQNEPALQQRIPNLATATFAHRTADTLEGLAAVCFDTVLLPSVVQYFPSIDYLRRVISGLLDVMTPTGAILISDVRSLPLLDAFYASLQHFKATPELTVQQIKQRVRQQLTQEQELAIAPAFFLALQAHLPQIRQVEILPKRGTIYNEMTCFRYDVVLHLGESLAATEKASPIETAIRWQEWSQQRLSAERIRATLRQQQPTHFALRGVANRRVQFEQQFLAWLAHSPDDATLAEFTAAQSEPLSNSALEPEELWQIGEELGYQVDISLARSSKDGAFDLLFRRRAESGEPLPIPQFVTSAPTKVWSHYANNPLREKLTRQLTPQLREFLKGRLPGHMVPTYITLLEELPLTPNGKVDRAALPPIEMLQRSSGNYVAPRSAVESSLAAIWAEVLGLEQVGIHDNFFEFGGHSLKATQVASRIHKELGAELPLRTLFSHPTIAQLSELLASQGAGQQSAGQPSTYQAIARVAEAADYPLSHAQHRLWVLAQMEPTSAAYNMPASLLLEGKLNVAAMEQAVQLLAARHESLRTTFALVNGEPRQIIDATAQISLRVVNLQAAADPLAQAFTLAQEDARSHFDLERGPLLRVALLKLGAERHVLLVNLHHIISDAWSEMVLVREFLALYQAACQGKPDPLPALNLHYRDYACWQRAFLNSEAANVARSYWHDKLQGELPILDLPSDFLRPQVKSYNGKSHLLQIDAAQTSALLEFSRRQQASLFMTLTAAVKSLLYRYCGQTDILVGTVNAGRTHRDLEEQIGFYINTLALRDLLQPDQPFVNLLQQVKATVTDAFDQQRYPFDLLVNELNLSRDVSRNPVFDVAVVLQNVETSDFALENVAVQPFYDHDEVSKFDLSFTFEVRNGSLHLFLTYNRDLFAAERIERMAGHFHELIGSILADANTPLARLRILPEAELRQIAAFNRATAHFAPSDLPGETIVSWFEWQVAQNPESIALCFEGNALSYGALNRHANQVAHTLIRLGIQPEMRVGLFVERSLQLVVGILGILKAGAAYVPFDPTSPRERLTFMLEDAQVPILVTQMSLATQIAASADLQLLSLDGDCTEIACASDHNPALPLQPHNTAYVIYTSGSTGKPKGVLVSHYNVVRLFAATEQWYHFNASDVWTLFHSCAFDFSVWELWGALFYGGRLVVVPYLTSRSPDAFYRLLLDERVTVLNQTPSAFMQLIEADAQAGAAQAGAASLALRTVIFGGEALEIARLRPWFERHGDQTPQLVNMYGITETTVHVTYRPITLADLARPASVIGCAIPDLELYILDPLRQPVPIGVAGEIYVGGAGVAQGYLRRPELTAERFVENYELRITNYESQDSIEHNSDAKVYKTGDLARYLANGDIEYWGRIDTQVKIRGFRIELGEIEAALLRQPAVRQAAVIVRGEAAEKQIVAYIVTGDALAKVAQSEWIAQLRGNLRVLLPEYMVPAAFVCLAELPLTGNGKLDRRALPAPEVVRQSAGDAQPQNEVERTIAAAWRQVLGVDGVGIHDNFFDLGGNSLRIVQLHRLLREHFADTIGVEIDVVELFQFATIRAQAEQINNKQRGQETAPALFDAADERAQRQKEARQRRRR